MFLNCGKSNNKECVGVSKLLINSRTKTCSIIYYILRSAFSQDYLNHSHKVDLQDNHSPFFTFTNP